MTNEPERRELYKDADWCRSKYWNEDLSLREIAAEAGCALRTIARWFKIHGIEALSAQAKAERRGNLTRGEKSGRWKGGPPRCTCGTRRSYKSKQCNGCRTREKRGTGNPKWRGEEIRYAAAHDRVKALHGLAPTHRCEHCSGQAAHWAYDHNDPNEQRDPRQGVYSADPAKYIPLCAKCHKQFDIAWRRAN